MMVMKHNEKGSEKTTQKKFALGFWESLKKKERSSSSLVLLK